jgi:hypothetical protein
MAFSRDFLKALNLTDEQVSAVIQEHTSVTDALKAQRDQAKQELETAKKEAAKVSELQKEIDGYKNGEDYKAKYEKAVKDHEDYVKGVEAKESAEKVKTAYRKLLADEQIKADRIDFVLNHTDLSTVKLDKDGNLTDVETLKKTINDSKDGWGVFKVTTKERKQTVANPPEGDVGSGAGRAREIYMNHLKQQGVKVEDTGKE